MVNKHKSKDTKKLAIEYYKKNEEETKKLVLTKYSFV